MDAGLTAFDYVRWGELGESPEPEAFTLGLTLADITKAVRPMKVYLDDERDTPDGWERVYWPDEAIALLKTNQVTEISLDHDLGDDKRGTGYDVVLWIEQAVALESFVPPKIRVHSANSSARLKMEAGIDAIYRRIRRQ